MWAVVLNTFASSPEVLATRLLAGPPRLGATRLLSIDGRAGAGKTGLALRTGELLDAPVVHLDDLYPGWDGLAEGVRRLRADVLEPLRDGRPGGYRRWDWHAAAPAELCPVPVTAVLVVEGVGASVAAAGLTTLSVWIDVDDSVRRTRAIARDGDAFAPHWESWAVQEQRLFGLDGTRAGHPTADVIIDNNKEHHR